MKKLFYIPVLAAVFLLFSGCKTDVGNTITTPAHPNFVITLDSNNGSNEKTSQTGEYGATITLNLNTFTYAGHDFNGWCTKKNPNVRSADFYNDGDSFHIVSNQTLYARWKAHDCVIRFHFNASGTNLGSEMADYSFCSDSNVKIPLSKFALDEKGFRGWTTSPSSTEVVYKDGESIPANTFTKSEEGMNYVDLYAIWETPDYWVTFYPNGGTGTAVKQGFFSGEEQNLMPCIFTKTDYVLKGWSTSTSPAEDASITYNSEAEITATSDIKLYAVWTKHKTVIRYIANGGEGSMSNTEFFYSDGTTVRPNTFTREHYNFKNWNTKSDGSGTAYLGGSSITLSTLVDEIILYAQWDIQKYTISYNDNKPYDGSYYSGSATQSKTREYGTTVAVGSSSYTMTHYTFKGWSDTKGNTYSKDDTITLTDEVGNVTLKGIWEPKTYTITMIDNRKTYETTGYGKSLTNISYYQTYKYGDNVTLEAPSITTFTDKISCYQNGNWKLDISPNYLFDGWSESNSINAECTKTYSDCKKCDFTVYGVWHLKDPVVIIEKNIPGNNKRNIDVGTLTLNNTTANMYGAYFQYEDQGVYKHIGFSDESKDGWAQYKISKTVPLNVMNVSTAVKKNNNLKKPIILYAVWYKFDSITLDSQNGYCYNESDMSKKANVGKIVIDKYELTKLNYYKVTGLKKPASGEEEYPHEFAYTYEAFNFIIELNKAFRPKYYAASGNTEIAIDNNSASTAYFGLANNALSSTTITSTNLLKCNRNVKGFRMPDPVEWCRAAKGTIYSFSNYAGNLSNIAWYSGNSTNEVHKVGQKNANKTGVYDIFGNLTEFVHYNNYVETNSSTVVSSSSSPEIYTMGGCVKDDEAGIQAETTTGKGMAVKVEKNNLSHRFGLRLVFDAGN